VIWPARLVGLAALLAFAVVPLVLSPDGVSAHSGYESSTPADGETLAESPARVDVYFGQEMARSGGLPSLLVVNDSGDQVDLGATLDDADRKHISAELAPSLPEGRYTVIWHTLSDEDGEEAQGAFHFYVGEPPSQPTPGARPTLPDKGTPVPTPTAAPTEPPTADNGGDDGAPVWLLVAGVLVALVIGGGIGLAIGRRSSA
jgi:methionine-rich copper-binding protein CopC